MTTSDITLGSRKISYQPAISGMIRACITPLRQLRDEINIHRSISHLHKLTDVQLSDIGIARCEIERIVRFGQ